MSSLIPKLTARRYFSGCFNSFTNCCYRNHEYKQTIRRFFSVSSCNSKKRKRVIHKTDLSKINDREYIKTTQPGFLESWNYGVEKFGSLKVDVPFSVRIQSLNPQEYPEMNKVFVKLLYNVDSSKINPDMPHTLHSLSKLYDLNIDDHEENFCVHGKFKAIEFPVLCHIEIPMQYDVDVTSSGKTVLISNLENSQIKIKTKSDSCTLRNVKSGMVDVFNEDGDILCEKVLQGNLMLKTTGSGQIKTERLQGLEINCMTDSGTISSTSVYANKSSFVTKTGDIELSNCHGNPEIKIEKGNLSIDSLDGSMDAQTDCGDVDVYVTKAEQIKIKTSEGSIHLKVPDTLQSTFELEGDFISVDPDLPFVVETKTDSDSDKSVKGYMNGKEGSIAASTMKGNVSLEKQDWLNSLKLKIPV